jgi:hypothetical protein
LSDGRLQVSGCNATQDVGGVNPPLTQPSFVEIQTRARFPERNLYFDSEPHRILAERLFSHCA